MRFWLLATIACVVVVSGCGGRSTAGSDHGGGLPHTVLRVPAGQSPVSAVGAGGCGSWVSAGVAAAYCGAGQTAPGPSGNPAELGFSGEGARAAATPGISQVM